MWEDTEIEKCMKNKLYECCSQESEANAYFASYTNAKKYLCDNIYKNIAKIEPKITDHSASHIVNVLNNIWKLINDESKINDFNHIELYMLCLCALFHDVGNINGREQHNRTIAPIYNKCRGNDASYNQERRSLLKIVAAHCGKTNNGDKDTLLEVRETEALYDMSIRSRDIAAIIRFADELAEGIQRTSPYLNENGMVDEESIIYHKYAEITGVFIDKGLSRIVLTYDIDYPVKEISFCELMSFVYKRILKLDAERRYCKYYAQSLDKYKTTQVTINITLNGDIVYGEPGTISFELSDKNVIKSGDVSTLLDRPELNINNIENKLKKLNSKTYE